MRLAAAAGWYWWLGGRRTEGLELLLAAADLPGEVTDDVRAMTYALVVLYVTSGRGDEQLGAEWIHKAYQVQPAKKERQPAAGLRGPAGTPAAGTGQAATAFESLLDNADPWVRAMARWQGGKMRILLGQGSPDVEAQLELALAEFRALGERFGISLALAELAGQLAMRGEFAGACEYFEQAIAALTELGAIEDVIEARTQQAMLYWLDGDREASAAAIADAERNAEGVTWPYALVDLALAKAKLARLGGGGGGGPTSARPRDQHCWVTPRSRRTSAREIHDLLGYLAEDVRRVPDPSGGRLAGGVRDGRAA